MRMQNKLKAMYSFPDFHFTHDDYYMMSIFYYSTEAVQTVHHGLRPQTYRHGVHLLIANRAMSFWKASLHVRKDKAILLKWY